ncbi:unannotated protein [freshwater metagenome]|uniref:Unannotated protein n=1 Tax=freshwater metagenome TaxID=449393 RepID=A0A6J6LKR6_9ZZZZ
MANRANRPRRVNFRAPNPEVATRGRDGCVRAIVLMVLPSSNGVSGSFESVV